MKNFDDILKSGKDKALGSLASNTSSSWRGYIGLLMDILHKTNDTYSDDSLHHIKIEQCKCEKCGKASFIIVAKDISDKKKIMRFHNSSWKAASTTIYYCNTCKNGRT